MNTIKNEPILSLATVIAAVLLVIGIKTDVATVTVVLQTVLPLVGGLIGRNLVSPVAAQPPVETSDV